MKARRRGKRRILEQSSPGRQRRLAWLVLPLALTSGFTAGAWLSDHWPAALGEDPRVLTRLSVVGVRHVPPAELAALAGVAAGTPLRELAPQEIALRVAAHPWIARARATRLPPNLLVVAVSEREPVALAWLGAPPRPWLVDREGTPFAPALGTEGYPRLLGVTGFEADVPHAALAQGVRILEALVAQRLSLPREIALGGDSDPALLPAFTLPTPDGDKRVILGGGADLEDKLARLASLLSAGRPETAAAGVIDVRFGEQVILRSLSSSEEGGTAEARGVASPPATGRSG